MKVPPGDEAGTSRKSQRISDILRKNKSKPTEQKNVTKKLLNNSNFSEVKKRLKELNKNVDPDQKTDDSLCEQSLKTLSLKGILRAIDELSTEPDRETKMIMECSERTNRDADIFWTSPTAILKATRYALLRRDWDNITHLMLLLLHHKNHYVPLIRKICAFMAKSNPLVKQLGLQKYFEVLNEVYKN